MPVIYLSFCVHIISLKHLVKGSLVMILCYYTGDIIILCFSTMFCLLLVDISCFNLIIVPDVAVNTGIQAFPLQLSLLWDETRPAIVGSYSKFLFNF